MKTIQCLLVACVMSFPWAAAAHAAAENSDHPVTTESEAARLKRISDEVHRRRALREAHGGPMQGTNNRLVSELVRTGGVFGPEGESGVRPAAGVSLNLATVPLVTVARLYAKLMNKEVMVSSKVAARLISLEVTEVPQDEAARAIQAAFVVARVRQVELDDTTVAWVDAR
jgi:hypothetical protein